MAANSGRRRRRGDDALPIVYFAIAVLLVVIALPTVLRPPQNPPSQTAELSPDVPPDDSQQSLISSFSRGTSGTAGAGEGIGASAGEIGAGPGGLGPGGPISAGPPAAARACPFGFGRPPRQTFSYFSAPCAGAWVGNNGGATSKGVTASEIRVAVGDPNDNHGTEGPVPDTPYPNESTADRTYRIWQRYFNTHYQFYGRRLQLVAINGDDNSDLAKQRAVATKADESYHVFAADIGRFVTMQELARRHIISFAEQGDTMSGSWLASYRPYMWETRMDATRILKFTAEFACKSLLGRPAVHAGDPTFTSTNRVLGLLYYSNQAQVSGDSDFRDELQKRCGAQPAISIGFPGDANTSLDASTTSTAAAKMRSAGVTTVISAVNVADTAAVTSSFTAQSYFPEWIVTGEGLTDCNFDAALQDQQQWSHAFGISESFIGDSQSLPGANMQWDIGWRAYKEVEPSTDPDNTMTVRLFLQLEQIANGIQMAGPNLTPESFEKGLFRMGPRTNDLPPWEWVGSFGPNDYSFSDKVGLIWWDPTATSDNTSNEGAYRWLNGGRRYGPGELPNGESPDFFRTGITKRSEATS